MTQLLYKYLCRTNRSAAEQLGAAGGASDLDFSTPPPLFSRGGGRASSRARRSSPPASERFICWVPGAVRALWSGRNRNLTRVGVRGRAITWQIEYFQYLEQLEAVRASGQLRRWAAHDAWRHEIDRMVARTMAGEKYEPGQEKK